MNTTFMKITVATIIAGSTLFSGTASAATKVETTATNQYTALKAGMTEKQLNAVLSGSGLGEWAGLSEGDARSVFSTKEIKDHKVEAYQVKLYVFQKSKTSRVYVEMSYDTKKKTYVIENHETF